MVLTYLQNMQFFCFQGCKQCNFWKKTNPLHVNKYQNLTLVKSSNEWYTIGMDWNILVLHLIACIQSICE
jgi:hypothetical protein